MQGIYKAVHTRVSLPQINVLDTAVDFKWIVEVLLRRSRLILGMTGVSLLLALFIVLTITPRYTATSQVLLDPRKQNLLGPEAIASDWTLDVATVDSQLSIIQSRSFLVRVVESENLTEDDEFGVNAPPSLYVRIRSLLPSFSRSEPAASASQAGQPERFTPQVLRTIGALQRDLRVERLGRAYVLGISVTSQVRRKAARLANVVANAYIIDQLEARYQAARNASEWLGDRIERLRNELRNSEAEVSRFRADNNLVAAVSGSLSEQQLSELNAKLVAARAESAEKRAKFEQAQRIVSEGGSLQSIPDVLRSPVIGNLRSQQAEVTRREADLIAKYGERHPAVVNVRAERQDNERQIKAEVSRIITNLRNDYDVALTRQESLERSLGVTNDKPGVNNTVAIRLRELERIAATNKTLYENFLSRSKISEEQANLEVRQARVISPATVPNYPSYPNKILVGAIALVFGLGAGVGTAFLIESLRRGFSTPQEVEETLELPALASVPLLTSEDLSADGKQMTPLMYAIRKPLSRFSEEIRALRAGIQMSDVDRPPKLIQVTSVVPSEGKTTIALAIAQSAATSFPRVLIVDCDLRRPAVSKLFGLENRAGLVDLLVGSAPWDSTLVRDPTVGFWILGAGSSTQNPPDLLASARMDTILNKIRDAFDYVVLDSPPLGPVIDAAVLTRFVDKIVFVSTWNDTPREVVARTIKQLPPERRIAGLVLNRVNIKLSKRYSGYYYQSKYYSKYYSN